MTVGLKPGPAAQHCDFFIQGLQLLKEFSVTEALTCFQRAYESSPNDDLYHNKYASYCGLARVLSGDRSGVIVCRDAARLERLDGDVYYNLACAEWMMQSRQRTIYVLEKGLQIDQQHPGLNKLKQFLGFRSENLFSFIPRNSFLNNTLGKLSRKKTTGVENWSIQQLL